MSILPNSFVNIINALLHEDESELTDLVSHLSKQDVSVVMLRAVMLTDKDKLFKVLLDMNTDINFRDKEGRTALFLAVKYNRLSMVRLLIDRGADVNLGKFNQSTALHLAAKKGSVEVIEMLIDAGHLLDALNWGGNSALLIACRFSHVDAVTRLISYGANVNICNKLGHYPLHYAAFAGNATLVKILMQKGGDPDVRTHLGINPIMLACERKHCSVVATLAARCNLHYSEQLYGGTVLHWAIASGCCHCVDCLLEHGASLELSDSTGRTPVLEAVQSKRPEILDYLLNKHEQEDFSVSGQNSSILLLAAFLGHEQCLDMVCDHEKTKHLINVQDSFGDAPIDLALRSGHKSAVKILLRHGADINRILSRTCTKVAYSDVDSTLEEVDAQCPVPEKDNAKVSLVSENDKTPHDLQTESRTSSEQCIDNHARKALNKTSSGNLKMDVFFVKDIDAKDKVVDLCMESTIALRAQTYHKVYKTYSAIKMGMIDMLRSASTQQMVAPVRFDFNTWLDNGPEAFVLKVTSLDLTNWIHQRMHTPWALRELCRGCVRRHLGYRASDKVELLPVPKTLRDFLNMKELDDIETSDIQIRSTGAFDDIDIE